MRQESATPGRFGIAGAAGDDVRGQAANRPAARVEQSGLARQALAVLDHPHHVPGALAQSAGGDHVHIGVVPEQLVDLLPEPPRR